MNTKCYFKLPPLLKLNTLTARDYFIIFVIFSLTCIFGYSHFSQKFTAINNTDVSSTLSTENTEYSSTPNYKTQIFAATDDVSDSYYIGNDNYQFPDIDDLKLLWQQTYKTFIYIDSKPFSYQVISTPNLRSPPLHS